MTSQTVSRIIGESRKQWWHLSPTVNRASILSTGLKVPERGNQQFYAEHEPGVYVFSERTQALNWAFDYWHNFKEPERGIDLWRVEIDSRELIVDDHPEVAGACYTSRNVPASSVQLDAYLDENGGAWPPSDDDGYLESDDTDPADASA